MIGKVGFNNPTITSRYVKYPIGTQDFPTLIESGFVYIDKTELIYKLVTNSRHVFLARPRRFGKSLLLSTIQAYFEGKKELFKGLAIESLEKEWIKYPVFKINLANVNNSKAGDLEEELSRQLSEWEKQLGTEISTQNPSTRFASILTESFKQTGRRAVVLVDEYDNPLINTLENNSLHDQNRDLLKSVYSNLKALDGYIQFGMLTGVSRFSKMTIFSGLNNLEDISFDVKYSTICGITENELETKLSPGIEEFAQHQGLRYQEAIHILKRNYDGYHFSENCPDIYNPFSLLNALANQKVGQYWFATGTPTFLVKKLYSENLNIFDIFNSEADAALLSSSDASHDSVLALLYQTGYLTIKDYDKKWDLYKLGIPNLEVKSGLFQDMVKVFQNKRNAEILTTLKKMVHSLENGLPDDFLKYLQSYLATIPSNITQKTSELYFENNIYIIFNLLGVYCKAETVIANGRIDIVIKTERYIYVLELKLDKPAEEALKQIEEKGYDKPFRHEDKTVFNIGVSFSSQTRNISSWKIKII